MPGPWQMSVIDIIFTTHRPRQNPSEAEASDGTGTAFLDDLKHLTFFSHKNFSL